MTDLAPPADRGFVAPGPGSWALDAVNFPRPATRYWAETQPAQVRRGSRDFARYYGMLIDGIALEYVNGFAYQSRIPCPEPTFAQRCQRAADVFAHRLWREQLRDWDAVVKPSSIRAHRSLLAVDPDAMTDAHLVAHLTRCRDHHASMMAQRMRFTATSLVPVGDFLAHVVEWTGTSPAALLGLLRGVSPVSAGTAAELDRVVRSVEADPAALELMRSDDDPAQVLRSLRSLGGETGAAMSDYLGSVGWRPLDGFDISEPTALELPDALLRSIRVACSGRPRWSPDIDDQTADVRRAVPGAHRGEFDELLGEARLTIRLRDERGIYSDIWASGLMRRAVLAAGRRLAAKGRIDDAHQLVEAGFDEMRSLIVASVGPAAAQLEARRTYRATRRAKDAPAILGSPPPPPRDVSRLAPAAARMVRAMTIAVGALSATPRRSHEESRLYGLAASGGVYEGPARRVVGPADFARITEGDILVTESTSEAFNILMPLVGAIVTDNGGLLSHSAILARELGIPGVVGTGDATELIADGARLRVDGNAGEVTILR